MGQRGDTSKYMPIEKIMESSGGLKEATELFVSETLKQFSVDIETYIVDYRYTWPTCTLSQRKGRQVPVR